METSCSKPSQPGLETEIKKEYEIEIKLEFGPNAVEEVVTREGGFGDHIDAKPRIFHFNPLSLSTFPPSIFHF